MPIIKCPECGHEVSSYAKKCINCGFPLSKCEIPQKADEEPVSDAVRIKKRRLLFLILSLFSVVICIIFAFLFIFTLSDWRTMYFTNNEYHEIAYTEIGDSPYVTKLDGGISYWHRMDNDDFVLSVSDGTYSFDYYLSNAEMRIEFCGSGVPLVAYQMIRGGVEVSDIFSDESDILERATLMKGMCDSVINLDLNGKCTVNDILTEYYNYCTKVNAIKVCGLTFSLLFLAAGVTLFVLYFKKPKLMPLGDEKRFTYPEE